MSMENTAADISVFSAVTALPESPQTTMAYVPFQTDKTMFDENEALNRGTLFKNLDKPFCRGFLK